jgi:hypothetical protein
VVENLEPALQHWEVAEGDAKILDAHADTVVCAISQGARKFLGDITPPRVAVEFGSIDPNWGPEE